MSVVRLSHRRSQTAATMVCEWCNFKLQVVLPEPGGGLRCDRNRPSSFNCRIPTSACSLKLWPASTRRRENSVRFWTAAVHRRFSHRLKIILHFHPVNLEAVNRPYLCRRCRAFKPRCGAPWVLVRHRHQFVLHRVLVDVIQPCQIAVLNRQCGVPKIEPDLPAFQAIKLIQIVRRHPVQMLEKFAEIP
jgi:hypothetical protein